MNKKTIMLIGAHADDEVNAGGTLVLHARAGDNVVICIVTAGTFSHLGLAPAETIKIRNSEVQASASVIGAKVEFLGLDEGGLIDSLENRAVIINAMRKYKPDIVLTHSPNDYHPDHIAVGEMVTKSQFASANVGTEFAPCSPPVVYYLDTARGINFIPDEYVDISMVIDKKIEMCRCHKSQYRSNPGPNDMEEAFRIQSRFRGIQAHVMYAEAFCLHPKMAKVRLRNQLSVGEILD
ncbi:MAG: PIG-L deacetylase family protein [Sedimentisphaerales bacterium]